MKPHKQMNKIVSGEHSVCQVGTVPWRRTKGMREPSDRGAELQ